MRRLLAVTLLAVGHWSPACAQPAGSTRSITPITDNLYYFESFPAFGMFLVTPEGIVVVDPLSTAAAEWLKGELESRFDVPVTHVVYSHHHYDHASGAAVFESATVVGHESAIGSLAGPPAGAPLPVPFERLDSDGDGLLQRSEASSAAGALQAAFTESDENGDGALDGREVFLRLHADVRAPDETFSVAHDLVVGGRTIRLIPVGGLHAPDMTYVLFPQERVLFVVDVIEIKSVAFMTIPDYDEAEQAALFDAALALEWDTVVPGHGEVGTRDDLLAYRQYLADLQAGVQAGIDAGRTLEQIQTALTLDQYKDWFLYDVMRQFNIEGMYAYLTRE